MNHKKLLCFALLFVALFGTTAPVLVSANETTSTTTVTTDSTTNSSVPTTELRETTQTINGLISSTETSKSEEKVTKESEAQVTNEVTANLERTGVLEAIIGSDDQYRVTDTTAYPYRSVVHLGIRFRHDYHVGSGVLISRNTILTVAHNVYDQSTGQWADYVVATPAKNETAPYGRFSSSIYYIMRGYKTEGDVTPSNYDIAVIKLNQSVPATIGSLSVSTSLKDGERVQIPGYPAVSSTKAGYMYTAFGPVAGFTGKQIGHLVDSEAGNSGSPILNANNQIVGIDSAGVETSGIYGVYNYGTRIDSAALDMIAIAQDNKFTTIDVTSNFEVKSGVVYRLYNSGIQRHLYTQDLDESNVLVTRGWSFEGEKFRTATAGTPVYRLYGKVMREHLYTTSTRERDILAATGAWDSEGVAFYSAGSTPIYRLYHAGIRVHLYTADANEVRVLTTRGWDNEGIAFYAQ